MAHLKSRPRRRRRRVKSARAQQRRFPWRRSVMIGCAVAAGFALGLLALTFVPKIFDEWRESGAVKRARAEFQADHFNNAIDAAQEALKFDRDSLPAFQVLADATEKLNRADTVVWRAQIARLQPRLIENQLNLASAALRFGQLDLARKALDVVPKENRDSAAYDVVAGWLSRAQGDEQGVDRHFAAALEKEPQNELYLFNFSALRIKSPDPEKRTAARTILERLEKSAPFRAGALRALLSDAVQRNDTTAADQLAQDLQMSPQVTFPDLLLCLDFYKKLDGKKFSALLDKVKKFAAGNAADLAALLEWMNKNGLSADVLRWMEKLPSEKTTNPPASVEIADAFATQKNWSRLRRWTRGGSWGDSEYLRLAYQALSARQSRQAAADAEFASLWHSAERACEEITEREIRLARLASKWNLPSEAEQLWLRVAHNPLTRREALDALFDIYRANNDLPNLYLTAQRLHETSPNEAYVAAEFARLSLLLDRNTKEGQRIAQEAFDQSPTDPLPAVAHALSLYSQGRSGEGIEVLRKLPSEKLHEPRVAVYLAVLLLDDNKPEVAREYIEAAHAGPIFTEEKKLLEEAQQKTQATPAPTPAPAPPAPVSPAQVPAASATP